MSDTLKAANQKLESIQLQQKAVISPSTASQQGDNVAHALAGAGGGLLSMALTYPLITLSTRAQVESKKTQMSTLEAVKKIIDTEGVSGLFSGLDSALFGIGVTNFVYYYWYEWSRSFFERRALASGRSSRRLTTIESMLAGALAGSATVLCTNPIWVVNTRMTARKAEASSTAPTSAADLEKGVQTGQLPKAKRPSTIGTLLAMINNEGIGSLFAGVLPALVLVANPILQYTIFEQLKNILERRRKARIGPYDSFYLGALGKLAATTITYPYITVKSRAHVRGASKVKAGPDDGMFASFSRILEEEGWEGLYGGYSHKIVQSVITTAFLFGFKDVLYQGIVKARREVVKKI